MSMYACGRCGFEDATGALSLTCPSCGALLNRELLEPDHDEKTEPTPLEAWDDETPCPF